MFDLSLSGGETGFRLDNEGYGEEIDMTEKQGELFEVAIGLEIIVSRDCVAAVETTEEMQSMTIGSQLTFSSTHFPTISSLPPQAAGPLANTSYF